MPRRVCCVFFIRVWTTTGDVSRGMSEECCPAGVNLSDHIVSRKKRATIHLGRIRDALEVRAVQRPDAAEREICIEVLTRRDRVEERPRGGETVRERNRAGEWPCGGETGSPRIHVAESLLRSGS